ncbi:MAG: glycosyltransferase family 39 protein [Nitrospinota bacterium]
MDNTTPNHSSLLKTWGIPLLIYVGLVGYFLSFSRYGFNIWDEGGYANGTLRTLNGERALNDFNPNGYLPGRYWYGVLFFKLFGVEIQSLRIGVILLTPAMVLMVYSISRKIMPSGFALLAALFMVSAPSMYYNRFYPFFVVLNLYFLTKTVEKRNILSFTGLVTSIFLSSFIKFEVTLFSILISIFVLGIPTFLRPQDFGFQWKDLIHLSAKQKKYFFAGGFTLVGLFLIYLGRDGYFIKVFKLVVDTHKAWGNPFPEIFPFFKLFEELGPHKMFEHILFYLPIGVYALAGVLVLSRFLINKWELTQEDLQLIAIVCFGICSFGLVLWRAGFDNLLRTLPPFYILFCYLLFLFWEKVLSFQNASENSFATRLTRVPLSLLIVFLPFLFYFEMNTYHGFYAGSIGAKSWTINEDVKALNPATTRVELEKMDVYTSPAEAKWIQEVVNRINLYSEKGDPILALPLNPIFYFLTDRINPTAYEWVLPGMMVEEEELKMVESLKEKPPKVVVYVDIAIDGKEERRLKNYSPHLYKFLVNNYGFQEMIGLFQILLPKH